eukprot:scaffold1629_cov369-Prasinococcus_capsulatus_cf.AAC.2
MSTCAERTTRPRRASAAARKPLPQQQQPSGADRRKTLTSLYTSRARSLNASSWYSSRTAALSCVSSESSLSSVQRVASGASARAASSSASAVTGRASTALPGSLPATQQPRTSATVADALVRTCCTQQRVMGRARHPLVVAGSALAGPTVGRSGRRVPGGGHTAAHSHRGRPAAAPSLPWRARCSEATRSRPAPARCSCPTHPRCGSRRSTRGGRRLRAPCAREASLPRRPWRRARGSARTLRFEARPACACAAAPSLTREARRRRPAPSPPTPRRRCVRARAPRLPGRRTAPPLSCQRCGGRPTATRPREGLERRPVAGLRYPLGSAAGCRKLALGRHIAHVPAGRATGAAPIDRACSAWPRGRRARGRMPHRSPHLRLHAPGTQYTPRVVTRGAHRPERRTASPLPSQASFLVPAGVAGGQHYSAHRRRPPRARAATAQSRCAPLPPLEAARGHARCCRCARLCISQTAAAWRDPRRGSGARPEAPRSFARLTRRNPQASPSASQCCPAAAADPPRPSPAPSVLARHPVHRTAPSGPGASEEPACPVRLACGASGGDGDPFCAARCAARERSCPDCGAAKWSPPDRKRQDPRAS